MMRKNIDLNIFQLIVESFSHKDLWTFDFAFKKFRKFQNEKFYRKFKEICIVSLNEEADSFKEKGSAK